ncbi:MAG: RagB/SusD family nutrient uptake outer membrane protein [Cyclobacteriaceae bacterium]
MKIKIILLISALILTQGCSNDFINLAPVSQLNANNFYKTAEDFENAVNAVYDNLQNGNQYGDLLIFFGEVRSDNTTTQSIGGAGLDAAYFDIDFFRVNTLNPLVANLWTFSYRGISLANIVIGRAPTADFNPQLKERVIAEAKFIRALTYFNLVRIYGEVPLVLNEVLDPREGLAHRRQSVDLIYDQIIEDLLDAEEGLSVSYSGMNLGRATKGAAMSLLGKVYMTLGQYADAESKLREVIDLNVYQLLDDYANVFDPANANHAEIVFEVKFKKGGIGEGSSFFNQFSPAEIGNIVTGAGSGLGRNLPTEDLLNAYEANDLRKEASIIPGYTNSAGNFVSFPFCGKFTDTPFLPGDTNDNWPVLRYADVLLLYAEAINENNGGPNINAYTYLNEVRQRAGLPIVENLNYEQFKLAVENERRIELAFEGHRWFDLLRKGRAFEVMSQKGYDIENPRDLLLPIPQSQIDVNPGGLTQNIGYF